MTGKREEKGEQNKESNHVPHLMIEKKRQTFVRIRTAHANKKREDGTAVHRADKFEKEKTKKRKKCVLSVDSNHKRDRREQVQNRTTPHGAK
jgi:hypothetical protein